jgi:DNA-binding LytR/AlgR family response regulator
MKIYKNTKELKNDLEVMYLRGELNYTTFFFYNGRKTTSSYNLLKHQQKLEGFVRVSKSHLLNPKYIQKVELLGDAGIAILNNGTEIKISRRRLNDVKFFINNNRL